MNSLTAVEQAQQTQGQATEAEDTNPTLPLVTAVPIWMSYEEMCEYLDVPQPRLDSLVAIGAVERRFIGRRAHYCPIAPRAEIRDTLQRAGLAEHSSGAIPIKITTGSQATSARMPHPEMDAINDELLGYDVLNLDDLSEADVASIDDALRAHFYEQDELTGVMTLIRDALGQRDKAQRQRERASHAQREALIMHERALNDLRLVADQRDATLEANRELLDEHHRVADQRDEALTRTKQIRVQRDKAIKHLARAVGQRDAAKFERDHTRRALQDTQDNLKEVQRKLEATQGTLLDAQRDLEEMRLALQDAQAERDERKRNQQRVAQQRDRAMIQLEKVISQRDAVMSKLDEALEERAMAIGHYDYAHQLLVEWNAWSEQAQQTMDDAQARAEQGVWLAQALLDTPWYAFKRRRALRHKLQRLQQNDLMSFDINATPSTPSST